MKQRKKQYYSNYLKNNIKNMKNTWKGIKLIISLKLSKSESPKSIINNKGEFLKLPKVPIAEHLCSIYNLSFTTRVFPDSLKSAKITTIYKKAQKMNVLTICPSPCSLILIK